MWHFKHIFCKLSPFVDVLRNWVVACKLNLPQNAAIYDDILQGESCT